MTFTVETLAGEKVEVEKTPSGELVAEDGSVYEAISNLKVQLKEAGTAIVEAVEEIGDVVEAAGEAIEEYFSDGDGEEANDAEDDETPEAA